MRSDFAKRCRELSQLLGDAQCGIVATQQGRGIVFANQCVLDWVQRDEAELLGRTFAQVLLAPELADAVSLEIDLMSRGDRRLRMVVLQRRDSSTFPALLVPYVARERGAPAWSLVLVLDLGAIQTAKPVRHARGGRLREHLDRIALELQALSLTAPMPDLVPDHPGLADLSGREKEVVALLLEGRRVPGIASRLTISPHTVRNHLKSIFEKLGVRSQTELVEHVRGLGQ